MDQLVFYVNKIHGNRSRRIESTYPFADQLQITLNEQIVRKCCILLENGSFEREIAQYQQILAMLFNAENSMMINIQQKGWEYVKLQNEYFINTRKSDVLLFVFVGTGDFCN